MNTDFDLDECDDHKYLKGTKCHISGTFPTETPVIDPDSFATEFQSLVNNLQEDLQSIKNGMNSDDMRKRTSISHLNYHGEPVKFNIQFPINPKEITYSLKYSNRNTKLNLNLETFKSDSKLIPKKYAGYIFTNHAFQKRKRKLSSNLNYEAGVFTIKIYRPFLSEGRTEDIRIQQEIFMRGSCPLSSLSEAIQCHLNYCGLPEVSQDLVKVSPINPFANTQPYKYEYPAYFFFINKKFYISKGVNLSREPREFLRSQGFGDFPTVPIANVNLVDVPIQLGRPYLYQHLGQCEHVIVFSDFKLSSIDDIQLMKPVVMAVSNTHPKYCMLCARKYAHWLVLNFVPLTIDRAFLCQRCFLSYCYEDGRKVGDFEAYQYLDPNVLT